MKGSILSKTLLLLLVLLAGTLLSNSTLLASDTLSGVVVCLDPGHGGDDPGAVNTDYDLRESDVNLDVVYGLKYLLENEGAEVVMTRTDDNFRTNEDRYIFCNEQMATILVSVHTNSVTDPTWDGSIALYAPNRDADLAHAIHDAMYPILHDTAPDQEAFIDFGLDNFASGVLFKCNMPSAMMEPLFMSNSAEAPLLQQPIFDDPTVEIFSGGCADFSCRRGEVAHAIYFGILNYYAADSTMHVAAIDMSYAQRGSTYFVYTDIAVEDDDANLVPAATVAVAFTLPDGSIYTELGVTGDNGVVTFQVRSKLAGEYKATVTSVSKNDWVYVPASNMQSSALLSVP